MEQIVFLVLVAVVGLIRWIAQIAENKRNEEAARREGPPPPLAENAPVQRQRPAAETEEERIRRFMEALGVPTTTTPPPSRERRQVVPKTPTPKIAPIDPFPKPTTTWMPPPPVIVVPPVIVAQPPPLPETPFPTRETTLLDEPSAAQVRTSQELLPAEFEVRDVAVLMEEASETTSAGKAATIVRPGLTGRTPSDESWAARLATSENLRDAIILREIFGPPRSMAPIG